MPASDSSSILGTECSDRATIHDDIRALILQNNYPCVAAIQSVVRNDHVIVTYGQFGSGTHWQQLRADLLQYLAVQRATQSRYMSFWAVFSVPPPIPDNETEFEEKLWRELSLLSSKEEQPIDWGKNNASDPNDHAFCLSLKGEKLFVVGLHPQSSRVARRFAHPAMVFNALSQFEQFEKDGTYGTMVNTIRRRELKFQGSINPMVLAHGDVWEAIQYSGRDNPDSWTCPFHLMKQQDKPR